MMVYELTSVFQLKVKRGNRTIWIDESDAKTIGTFETEEQAINKMAELYSQMVEDGKLDLIDKGIGIRGKWKVYRGCCVSEFRYITCMITELEGS